MRAGCVQTCTIQCELATLYVHSPASNCRCNPILLSLWGKWDSLSSSMQSTVTHQCHHSRTGSKLCLGKKNVRSCHEMTEKPLRLLTLTLGSIFFPRGAPCRAVLRSASCGVGNAMEQHRHRTQKPSSVRSCSYRPHFCTPALLHCLRALVGRCAIIAPCLEVWIGFVGGAE